MATKQDESHGLAGRIAAAIGDKIKDNHMQQPSFTGQLASLGREMAKDAQSTVNEVFFGKPSGPSEPGTPLAPTQAMVTHDLTGKMSLDDLRKFADGKAREASRAMDGQQQERGGRGM